MILVVAHQYVVRVSWSRRPDVCFNAHATCTECSMKRSMAPFVVVAVAWNRYNRSEESLGILRGMNIKRHAIWMVERAKRHIKSRKRRAAVEPAIEINEYSLQAENEQSPVQEEWLTHKVIRELRAHAAMIQEKRAIDLKVRFVQSCRQSGREEAYSSSSLMNLFLLRSRTRRTFDQNRRLEIKLAASLALPPSDMVSIELMVVGRLLAPSIDDRGETCRVFEPEKSEK